MSELQEIKKKIYIEQKIEFILESLECWGIDTEQRGNLFVAGLPDGDNKRSVQIKNSENLTGHIRSKGIDGDIYDIVSFVLYNADTEQKRKEFLYKSKFWICEKLNYIEFIDDFYKETLGKKESAVNQINWLKSLRKKRKNELLTLKNKVYPSTVLSFYGCIPYKKWIDEGISFHTQKEYGVGIDVKSERITFPIHNKEGELVGVKGRYCGRNDQIESDYKYLYILPCNKSIEFFNLHRALPHIKAKNEVIVVEGGKTTMLLHQWGYKNCISIEGDSLSDYQIAILKELGLKMKYVFAYDKDKDADFIVRETTRLSGRMKYGIYDNENLLKEKDSPTDKGRSVWEKLYNEYIYKL